MTGRFPLRAGVPVNGNELAPAAQDHRRRCSSRSATRPAASANGTSATRRTTDPNAHGFDYYYGFHSGCVDYYSHRYYWGGTNLVNYHDLWRNRTEIFEDGQYLTERIAAEAKQFIAQHKANPFFMYVPFNAPHYPMHAPEKYVKRVPQPGAGAAHVRRHDRRASMTESAKSRRAR